MISDHLKKYSILLLCTTLLGMAIYSHAMEHAIEIDYNSQSQEQECAQCYICYSDDFQTSLANCIHCRQLICKECAKKCHSHSNLCPYCRQKITQEQLQQMIEDANTPLHRAVHEGNAKMVQLLLDAKADVNQNNEDGDTPLYVATHMNNEKIVNLLLSAGALVNKANHYGNIPLHTAARKNHKKIAHLLLSAGADVNRVNNNGATPLHSASHQGHIDMVTLLLTAGADVTIKTKKTNAGELTAFQLARVENHHDIAALLSNHQRCMQKLIKEGADTAFELASDSGYDSHVLYNCILNMIANSKKIYSRAYPLNVLPPTHFLHNLSLKELCKRLSPLRPKNELEFSDLNGNLSHLECGIEFLDQNDDAVFSGWKEELKKAPQKPAYSSGYSRKVEYWH